MPNLRFMEAPWLINLLTVELCAHINSCFLHETHRNTATYPETLPHQMAPNHAHTQIHTQSHTDTSIEKNTHMCALSHMCLYFSCPIYSSLINQNFPASFLQTFNLLVIGSYERVGMVVQTGPLEFSLSFP